MSSPKDTEQQKTTYLADHVRYEREMLKLTFAKLHSTAEGPEWNVVFESFGVHARNLYDFLRHEGKRGNTFRADDYVPGRPKPPALLAFNDLDTFLFHMAADRAERAKLSLGRLQELGAWIDREWAVWAASLPTAYQGLVDAVAVCPRSLVLVGVTTATACTAPIFATSG